jgi:DNA-binding SARP family transcriptional activator/tetratricopeptide (TPR) repeat protein
MEIRILGPVEVEIDGRTTRLGRQQRVVLALLALEANKLVPSRRLVELVWGDPASEALLTTLRSHVMRLRRVLEPDRPAGAEPRVLLTEGSGDSAGYRLRIGPEQLDAMRFERLAAEGREALLDGDPHVAVERLRAGLMLWRGPALAEMADRPFVLGPAARLEGLRRAAEEGRIEADLALGRHADVVGELEVLVTEEPGNEGLRRLLVLALYRCRRTDKAVRVCREGLQFLHQKGLDSSALQRLEHDVLRNARELDWTGRKGGPVLLPPDIPEFTGRWEELRALRERLCPSGGERQTTVVISAIDGTPGIGKSALAIHLAHELSADFNDGVLYANLRGVGPQRLAPLEVLGRFLRNLGAPYEEIPAEVEAASATYRSRLSGKRVLVILDNAADAAQVRPLLPGSPTCGVLITSRAQLTDLEGAAPLTLDVFPEEDAVELLASLAGQQRVDADLDAAARIVQQCGLLPLAVRIAGARLRARPAWPLTALTTRLADERGRLGELVIGDVAVRSSFLLSYRDLASAEAQTFRLLSLLPGGEATPGCVAALTERTVPEAQSHLEQLVDVHLLETPAPDRYRFHDLLRLFAWEQAHAEDSEANRLAAIQRALEWYLITATQATRLLAPVDPQPPSTLRGATEPAFTGRAAALAWLEAERSNLVAAVHQAAGYAPAPLASVAVQLSNALFHFFNLRKHWPDWEAVCRRAVQAARDTGNRTAQAAPLNHLGIICFEQRRLEEAITCYGQSLQLRRELCDHKGQASTLSNLGNAYRDQGRFGEAAACYEESLRIKGEIGDYHGQAGTLNNLGNSYREQGRFEEAIACLQGGLAICRDTGDRHQEGQTLNSLGDAFLRQQRFPEAITHYDNSLQMSREVGDRYGEGLNLSGLGAAIRALNGRDAAQPYWRESLDILTTLGAREADVVRACLDAGDEKRSGGDTPAVGMDLSDIVT